MSMHGDDRGLEAFPDDEGPWPTQTSGSRWLSNRAILTIMIVFIVVGAILIGGPTVLSLFSHK